MRWCYASVGGGGGGGDTDRESREYVLGVGGVEWSGMSDDERRGADDDQ